MRLLLSGGGTGGHIYPALALAEGIKKEIPDCKILFVGAKGGMEEVIIPAAGYHLKTLDISGIDRSSPRNALQSLLKIPGALREARRVIHDCKPDVVAGTGGYASFPVVYAAARQGIPTAIHEQNAYPGIVNRFLASRVDVVMLTFADARDKLKARRCVVTGLPVREAVLTAAGQKISRDGAGEHDFTLLAFGGSLGAQVINQAVWELLPLVQDDWRIIWVTGKNSHAAWKEKLDSAPGLQVRVEIHPYLHNIETAMAESQLVLCRAGASTLAELTVMGLPAILIPYPYAAENHQEKNARSLEAAGGARVIADNQLNGSRLRREIMNVKPQLDAMAAAMRTRAIPQARNLMVEIIKELKNRRK